MLIQSKSELIDVVSNELVAKDTYKLVLDKKITAKAGQFINIKVANHYLRRPLSISKINKDNFEIIYRIKGSGTKELAKEKNELDILYPLGNGFKLVENKKVLVVGGGIGIPPLLQLIDELKSNNEIIFLIGLNEKEDNIYQEYNPLVSTVDGSEGYQGNVIDYLNDHELEYDYIYACGPIPMLNAIQNYTNVAGQISIEARMGCGFGACMGCSCKTKDNESKRVCVEGPVFEIGELDLNEY